MRKTIEPLGDRVVLVREKPVAVTQGGVHIPNTSQDKTDEGYVTAVGPNVEAVAVLDRVLFGKYSGTDVEVDGKHVTVMREGDIIAIIKEHT